MEDKYRLDKKLFNGDEEIINFLKAQPGIDFNEDNEYPIHLRISDAAFQFLQKNGKRIYERGIIGWRNIGYPLRHLKCNEEKMTFKEYVAFAEKLKGSSFIFDHQHPNDEQYTLYNRYQETITIAKWLQENEDIKAESCHFHDPTKWYVITDNIE